MESPQRGSCISEKRYVCEKLGCLFFFSAVFGKEVSDVSGEVCMNLKKLQFHFGDKSVPSLESKTVVDRESSTEFTCRLMKHKQP